MIILGDRRHFQDISKAFYGIFIMWDFLSFISIFGGITKGAGTGEGKR